MAKKTVGLSEERKEYQRVRYKKMRSDGLLPISMWVPRAVYFRAKKKLKSNGTTIAAFVAEAFKDL